jgi:hypothetical protein
MAKWSTPQQLRREKLRLRQSRLFARRECPEVMLTEELARLRGIESEAFHLLNEVLSIEELPSPLREAIGRLEHAVWVEVAALPTLKVVS